MNRILIVISIMAATLMQALDTTIINVALPHMQGSLSAKPDQITWILTSYMVASAIFMPLTGYFTDILGQKKYLMISIGGFVIFSALCGLSINITQIVVFRLLQGIFGAAIVPLSQTIMTNLFSDADRGKAMAIWGVGVMIGPIIGPTLGGYITELATWRWNFYINVPIGIICLLLLWQNLPSSSTKLRNIDWIGLVLMSMSIGALQYFLDRGNQEDWFESREICIAMFLMIICFLGFMLYNVVKKNEKTVFDLTIFLDRNFAISSTLLAVFGLGLFGSMVILPMMLENLFDYPVITTGLVMGPRGVTTMFSMMLVGVLIKKIDARLLIMIGIIIGSIGTYIGTYYNLYLSPGWVIAPIMLQGLGFGMVFVPLSTVAFATLPVDSRSEASGLFSLLRTIGGSIGISIVSTLLIRETQTAWNQLGGFINPFNPILISRAFHWHQLVVSSSNPLNKLTLTLVKQSQMQAFVNVYAFITISFLMMIPLIFLLKKPKVYL
ncbi:MAG: DHA2 family efflux MFS transporter permease subunit [Gammaproteobacteria bacterium]|jgi:DHA2 family multidrug resistance protein